MSLHRFIITTPLHAGRMNITDPAIIHQFERVLRFAPGQTIMIGDGRGNEAQATLVRHDSKGVLVEIEAVQPNRAESPRPVTLYCAILKRQNFELVVQKATELGVSTVVPLLTERTVKQGLRRERLLSIIREAAEQSGRGRLPELGEPLETPTALQAETIPKFWLDPTGKPWQSTLVPAKHGAVSFWIGPEGGWTSEETAQAVQAGATIVSFGPRTLRAETAAIAAVSLVIYAST